MVDPVSSANIPLEQVQSFDFMLTMTDKKGVVQKLIFEGLVPTHLSEFITSSRVEVNEDISYDMLKVAVAEATYLSLAFTEMKVTGKTTHVAKLDKCIACEENISPEDLSKHSITIGKYQRFVHGDCLISEENSQASIYKIDAGGGLKTSAAIPKKKATAEHPSGNLAGTPASLGEIFHGKCVFCKKGFAAADNVMKLADPYALAHLKCYEATKADCFLCLQPIYLGNGKLVPWEKITAPNGDSEYAHQLCNEKSKAGKGDGYKPTMNDLLAKKATGYKCKFCYQTIVWPSDKDIVQDDFGSFWHKSCEISFKNWKNGASTVVMHKTMNWKDLTCTMCDMPIHKGYDMIIADKKPYHVDCAQKLVAH